MASTITAVGHGLVPDDPFQFRNVSPETSGVDENATYHVLSSNWTTDTFEFTDEGVGGAAVTLAEAITDGQLEQIPQYVLVVDGVMDPPDPNLTPDAPTVDSVVVAGIVRLSIAL